MNQHKPTTAAEVLGVWHQVPKPLHSPVTPTKMETWPHNEQLRWWQAIEACIVESRNFPERIGKLLHKAETELRRLRALEGVTLPDRRGEKRNHIEQGEAMHSDPPPDVFDHREYSLREQSRG